MRHTHLLAVVVALVSTFARADDPIKSMPSFPTSLSAKEVREFPKLAIDFGNVKLRGEAITVVPISIESGVTGVVLLGSGTFSYSPDPGKQFEGHYRSAMLRFNPKDAEAIIKLSAGETIFDRAQPKGAAFVGQYISALLPPRGRRTRSAQRRNRRGLVFSGTWQPADLGR